jgi:hypothetical protein
MNCKNRVMQSVPTKYSYKQIELACGSTSIYGTPLYCDECAKVKEVKPVWQYEDAGEADLLPFNEFWNEYGD